jgi:rhodanese-related sulfurtransferase
MTSRKGAAALVGAAALYAVAALATGRSARAELPPDLSAKPQDVALDVWRAAAAIVSAGGEAAVVDLRPADAFGRYHLPAARNLPGASGREVVRAAVGAPVVLVYAGKDEVAQAAVAEAREAAPGARVFYLPEGARAWYLAFELPVPLFSDQGAPAGYGEALARARSWLAAPGPQGQDEALEAVEALAKASYQPNLLQAGAKKPAAAGGARKKISGGCG